MRIIDTPDSKIHCQLIGDISLNGLYCDPQHHEAVSNNMAEVAALLGACDLRMGNLESPIWGNGGFNRLKSPRLNTTREAANCILPLGLDVVLLANNHVFDCREEGFENTVQFLNEHGIKWLGAGRSPEEAANPLILELKGLRIGLLNYVGRETNPNLPSDAGIYLNWLERDRVLSDVTLLKDVCDYVLVFLHWGDVELVKIPSVKQRLLARSIAKVGADAIIGSHVHCLQGSEIVNDCCILYSIGNFLFNPDKVNASARKDAWPSFCREVGVASLHLSKSSVELTWNFFYQSNGSLTLAPDPDLRRQQIMTRLCHPVKASDRVLALRYKIEHILSQLRTSLSKRGLIGLIYQALLPYRWKQFFNNLWVVLSNKTINKDLYQ